MSHCKHLAKGKCTNCTKHCPIKAQHHSAAHGHKPPEADMEFATPPPALTQALAHGERVARLAETLFAALAPLHQLAAPWDAVLRAAALLHDIGWVYGQQGHHKASARMIRAGAVAAVAEDIRPLAALVARYHRKAVPATRQTRFAALSSEHRRGVRCLAALLRLADALDFGHAALVQHIDVTLHDTAVHLTLDCPQGCAAEMNRIESKKAFFQKLFRKDVLCQLKAQKTAEPTPSKTTSQKTDVTPAPKAAPSAKARSPKAPTTQASADTTPTTPRPRRKTQTTTKAATAKSQTDTPPTDTPEPSSAS